MILNRTDELLATLDLPELEENREIVAKEDALITCAGFEDRALEFLKRCAAAGCVGFRLIGIKYLPEVAANRLRELEALAKSSSAVARLEVYDRQAPQSVMSVLTEASSARRVWIDISGMSRLLIVQLIACAVRLGLSERVRIVYTEAKVYPPSEDEFAKKLAEGKDYLGILNFISSGVYGITIVPELSTVAMQGQPVRLVTFPSFNPTQLAAVTAEIQASSLTIINGVPPRPESLWRKEAIRQLNGVESLREKEECDTSTLDYRETFALLLRLYGLYGATQKIVVSPTGSKMQSVAVGLVCGFLRDIQVVYPTPQSFPNPTNYTSGVRKVYQLALSRFSKVPASLDSADRYGEAGEATENPSSE